MTTPALPGARVGAPALLAAGVLFVAYPVLRPYADLDVSGEPAAFGSPLWFVAHLAAVAGFLLAGLGVAATALRERTATTTTAVLLWWFGSGLTLCYYGAETFALPALAGTVDDPARLAALAEAVRTGPVQTTVFGVGLVSLAVAAVLTAVALRRSAGPAGWAFAVAMVLFLPQFFAAPPLRIAHGVLLGIGCVLLARALWAVPRPGMITRTGAETTQQVASAPPAAITPLR